MVGFAIGALVVGEGPAGDFGALSDDEGGLDPAQRVKFAGRDDEFALAGRARHFDGVHAPDPALAAVLHSGDEQDKNYAGGGEGEGDGNDERGE
jgi:hypothetical protein